MYFLDYTLDIKCTISVRISGLFYSISCSGLSVPFQCWLSFDRPTAVPKSVLQRVRNNSSSFNFKYPVVSLTSSSSCLLLIPRLPIPSALYSVGRIRRQFLNKMWPIQLAFLFLLLVGYPVAFCTCYFVFHTIGPTDLLHSFSSLYFRTIKVILIFTKCSSLNTIRSCAPSLWKARRLCKWW